MIEISALLEYIKKELFTKFKIRFRAVAKFYHIYTYRTYILVIKVFISEIETSKKTDDI